jgi:hypothetical protein
LPVRVDFEKAPEVDPVRESKPVAVVKKDLVSIVKGISSNKCGRDAEEI